MVGTLQGGKKAAKTNKEIHGEDFYARIGQKGGRNGHTGGFASDVVGKDGLTGRERAKRAGQIGGLVSRRGTALRDEEGNAITKEGKKYAYPKNVKRPRKCPTEVPTPEHGKKESIRLWQRLFSGVKHA